MPKSETKKENWAEVVACLEQGDRAAFLKLGRLIAGFLASWRAYDFQQEWPDLIQEVIVALLVAKGSGRIRAPAATLGYIRQVTRNKFNDRLRHRLRSGANPPMEFDEETVSWDLSQEPATAHDEAVVGIRHALAKLSEAKRVVLIAAYGQGRTYEQIAQDTGIPLGSVKRYLREGLAELRQKFGVEVEKT